MPDVHWCITVDYEQIVDSNIANQIHVFTIDYGKFILMNIITRSQSSLLHCSWFEICYFPLYNTCMSHSDVYVQKEMSTLSMTIKCPFTNKRSFFELPKYIFISLVPWVLNWMIAVTSINGSWWIRCINMVHVHVYVLFSDMISFSWRRKTWHKVRFSSIWFPRSWLYYQYSHVSCVFFVGWQRNPPFERFCWNSNAENSSWLGKECAYCLSEGKFICSHEPFQLCF